MLTSDRHDTTRIAPPRTASFGELLSRAASAYGDRVAIRHRDVDTSFAGLAARAASIAHALADAGVRPGDRCAVLVRAPADAAAAFFAVLGAGGVGLTLNEQYRPRQIEFALRQAEVRVLLASRDALATLPRPLVTTARVIMVEEVPERGARFEPLPRGAGDEAQITFTSGSTGQPKGVVASHANLWAGVRVVAGYLGLRADDRIAGLLPFSFVYGFNQLTTTLLVGATLVVERSPLASQVLATLRRERVTVLAAVPTLWKELLALRAFRDAPIPHLRLLTNAGGALPASSVRELRRAQPQARLFLMYGLSEVFRSTFLPPEEVDDWPGSIGRAVPGSTVYVVRDDGTIADAGEVGELVHGGPTVALGYVGDADATARVFRPNPFRAGDDDAPARVVYSGDLVRRDEGGRHYFVGRRDRMIKTLGHRVSPDEVCEVIQASGQVTDAAVVTAPDEQRGQGIIACLVLREGGSVQGVTRFCATELPRYMQPVRYVAMSALPRNANGKHDLAALSRVVTPP